MGPIARGPTFIIYGLPGRRLMLHTITCPVCGQKQRVAENVMRQRIECIHCHAAYVAGSSKAAVGDINVSPGAAGAEQRVPVQASCAAAVSESAAQQLVRYQCPRCGRSLESPSHTAGQKLNCPGCGQRLQVPKPAGAATVPSSPVANSAHDHAMIKQEPGSGSTQRRKAKGGYCLECRRDFGSHSVRLACPKCGSLLCSAGCLRDHDEFAHGR